MLRKAAVCAGIIFGIVGVVGLAPQLFTHSDATVALVFGSFIISSEHSPLYLITATLAFAAARSERWATWFFRVVGSLYTIIAVYAFSTSETTLGFMNLTTADDVAHIAIGIGFLVLGFGAGDTSGQNERT